LLDSEEKMEKIICWLQDNRIALGKTDEMLKKLEEMGATEVEDLGDLDERDLASFDSPFLKKLEFVRFKRAVEALKAQPSDLNAKKNSEYCEASSLNNAPHVVAVDDDYQDSLCNKVMNQGIKGEKHGVQDQEVKKKEVIPGKGIPSQESEKLEGYQRPPLPSMCPQEGCNGLLSSSLGNRKNKKLKGPNRPDRRWIVSCSKCPTKWHACHFLCGQLSKITPMGSSDIVRHEVGRYNRWQKKVKPPCHLNPMNSTLKQSYEDQKKKSRQSSENTLDLGKGDLDGELPSGKELVGDLVETTCPFSGSKRRMNRPRKCPIMGFAASIISEKNILSKFGIATFNNRLSTEPETQTTGQDVKKYKS